MDGVAPRSDGRDRPRSRPERRVATSTQPPPEGGDAVDRRAGDATGDAGQPVEGVAALRRPIILGQVREVQARIDWRRLAAFLGVLAVFGWVFTGFMARSGDTYRIVRRYEDAAREVARQEMKVEALRTQVAYLATDAYVEVAAREKLGLVKPGDHPVIILPERDEVAWVPPPPPARPAGPFGPAYGRIDEWFRLFFGGADEGILGKS